MNRSPAFQFYPDKWQSHTRRLSNEAYRVFHELLCWMWQSSPDHCSVDNSPEAVAVAVAMPLHTVTDALAEIQNAFAPLLKCENGRLVCNGLRKEINKQENRRDKASANANARWKDANASKNHADASIPQCFPSPIPSPSPPTERGNAPALDLEKVGVEIPDEKTALSQADTRGIPKDFSRLCYADWFGNEGRNAKNVPKPWLTYLEGRWRYEEGDWKSGKHRGRTATAAVKPQERSKDWPTLEQVVNHANEKWPDEEKSGVWGSRFYSIWNARQWKKEWTKNRLANRTIKPSEQMEDGTVKISLPFKLPDINYARSQGWISDRKDVAPIRTDSQKKAQQRECMKRLREWRKVHGEKSNPPRRHYKIRSYTPDAVRIRLWKQKKLNPTKRRTEL